MQQRAFPMETILADIERALAAELWYVALAVTLSIPDICSILEEPAMNAWSKRAKYARWFDTYVGHKWERITGDDCYNLRGGVLHSGHFGHPQNRYLRVVFTLPAGMRIRQGIYADQDRIITHPLKEMAIVSIDLVNFCESMIESVREWHEARGGEELIQSNLQRLVRHFPNGLDPVPVPFIG